MDAILQEMDAALPWFFPVLAFVLGATIGSFLNVCIYRVPKGQSVVHPGSHCACGEPVRWHDNVPILGWFFLGGKARCCDRRLPFRYPFVELLTASLFLGAWLMREPSAALAGMVFICFMVLTTFVDLDEMLIPDVFSVGGTLAGLVLAIALPGLHGFAGEVFLVNAVGSLGTALLGMAIGSAIILWIKIFAESLLNREAMGEGDIVLMGAIGAFCGWQGAVFAIFGGAFLGTVVIGLLGLFRLGKTKKKPAPDAPLDEKTSYGAMALHNRQASIEAGWLEDSAKTANHVPFGPMLAGGGVLYFLFFHPFVDRYFAQVHEVLIFTQP